jgi:hypothetical protein
MCARQPSDTARVAEQRLCTYELCESSDEETAVIQHGEAYSLNRSVHGILILIGTRPRTQHRLPILTESLACLPRWHDAMNYD